MTILYSTALLDGNDASGSSRVKRTIRWVDWYSKIGLVHDQKVLLDNASEYTRGMTSFMTMAELVRFDQRLERGGVIDYPYCWRGTYWARNFILQGAKKVIFIDTDCFIVTKQVVDYVNELNSGWTSFWCQTHNFPEAAIHVLCEDMFEFFLDYTKGDFMEHNGKLMETALPFTGIERRFNCGRWGELGVQQGMGMDIYCQASLNNHLAFDIRP